MPEEKPLTVTQLTRRITLTLEDFGPLLVQGELSQVRIAPSGHLYATLKDDDALISVVMWRSSVVRNSAKPQEGEQVIVKGSLAVYGQRGQYQIIATRISPVGLGDLAARFAALKAKLTDEGLFDDERKRMLPLLPRCVGIATASGSAALADMLHSLQARFPSMPIVHAPCVVQGAQAVASIVAALQELDRHPDVDVIIVGRGGGSIEDLWAFNEEAVVRAIAACRTPVVSAVGHETDTTLADFVADVRAKTPTAAGELVVPVEEDLHAQLNEYRQRLDRAIDSVLIASIDRLMALASHRALATPQHQVAMRQQRLDELHLRLEEAVSAVHADNMQRLHVIGLRLDHAAPTRQVAQMTDALAQRTQALARAMSHQVQRAEERLAANAARLDALSPLGVLARGYSVVRTPKGKLVRRTADVSKGDSLQIRLSDGTIRTKVE